MPPIPDTGGGVSGFLAYGLWHVYRYFPFSGTWDWLLLFFSLALVLQVLLLPVLHKILSFERRVSPDDFARIALVYMYWHMSWLWVFIWFFQTPAGRTFLEGRDWLGSTSPMEVSRTLFWVSLVCHYILLWLVSTLMVGVADIEAESKSWRTVSSGGRKMLCSGYFPVGIAFLAHLFYWYWSVASLVLMLAFAISITCFAFIRNKLLLHN